MISKGPRGIIRFPKWLPYFKDHALSGGLARKRMSPKWWLAWLGLASWSCLLRGSHKNIKNFYKNELGANMTHDCQPQTPTLMRCSPDGSLWLTYVFSGTHNPQPQHSLCWHNSIIRHTILYSTQNQVKWLKHFWLSSVSSPLPLSNIHTKCATQPNNNIFNYTRVFSNCFNYPIHLVA